jgi:hypothetical protein
MEVLTEETGDRVIKGYGEHAEGISDRVIHAKDR